MRFGPPPPLQALLLTGAGTSGSGGSAPSPPVVTSGTLILHLEADRITGLADWDPVPLWPGGAGTVYDATQGSEEAQPVWIASDPDFNDRPIVMCDGIDDGMLTDCDLVAPYTLFYLGQALHGPLSAGRHLQSRDTNSLISFNVDQYSVYAADTNIFNDSTVTPGAAAAIGCLVMGGGTNVTEWRLNAANMTGFSTISGNWGRVALNGSGAFAQFVSSKVAAVAAFSGALNDADRNAWFAYLATKYGISI